VAHIPGLKVALPSSAYEAKGLMKTAIRDNNPVVIFEDKLMYQDKAPVPEEEYLIPFGEANVKREGRDITLIATSSMVQVAEKAAEIAGKGRDRRRGDRPAHHRAARREDAPGTRCAKTIARHRHRRGAPELWRDREIAARINEKAFYHLDAPVHPHGGHGRAGALQRRRWRT
jgi:pyruvate/2-oxoglutarate/acetoin dehydrogenase E1 component